MHFGIILEEIKSSHHAAPLSLLGRAEPIGRRAPTADGATARALRVWLCRCVHPRLVLAVRCKTALPSARQSAVSLWPMQPSSAVFHTMLRYPLMQIAAYLSCLLPSLSALLRRVSVMLLLY